MLLLLKLYAFHEFCSILSSTAVRGILHWGEYNTIENLVLVLSLNLLLMSVLKKKHVSAD